LESKLRGTKTELEKAVGSNINLIKEKEQLTFALEKQNEACQKLSTELASLTLIKEQLAEMTQKSSTVSKQNEDLLQEVLRLKVKESEHDMLSKKVSSLNQRNLELLQQVHDSKGKKAS
jgi:hypothetical protein